MHQSFLQYVLDDLLEKEVAIESLTFVLPSKRSGTFLKKHISHSLTKNSFSPKILAIEDFVEDISGITSASSIDLLIQLYSVYKSSKIEAHDDFYTFLKWGQTLLQDFNEIDRYLIPSKDILNYLSAIKELNHWSLKTEKTELIQNYLQLWNSLESLYDSFTTSLLTQKKGYQGLIYRKTNENLEDYCKTNKNDSLVFIGFNALNSAESNIIQYFLEHTNSQIYWDIDSYFLDDAIHDAGLFIRNYTRQWPYYRTRNLTGVHTSFLSSKNISITGVPKSISQAKYVGEVLRKINSESHTGLKNTALVLADESLLNPILQAIPNEINEVNITMGLPLNKTVLYSFFLSFLELNIANTEKGWFYKDVLEFLSNPYSISISASQKIDFAKAIPRDIKETNRLYLSHTVLSKYVGAKQTLEVMFPPKTVSSLQWIDNCLLLIQNLKKIFSEAENSQELESLYRFYTLFNQLRIHLSSIAFKTGLKSVKSLFKQLATMEALDFIGEPLSGLQIMGMLESRNLDFETVILTSVNEGILPSGKSNNSFIPFDVKQEYGLPTYKEKDAIYTYHFYRLIQRAKNIHIIYNTEPDVLEGGEKSRLISQLLADDNVSKYVTHNIASPQVKISPTPISEVSKSPLLVKDIVNFADKGFSPTSLTNYIRNPLEFYKKNILKINDVSEVEETIAANTFGTIVHDSLEELYQPLINKILTLENTADLATKTPEVVKTHFYKNLPGVDILKGKFLLVFNVIVKYLQNFIAQEIKQVEKHEIKILGLEEKLVVQLNIPELDFPIKLKGTLDRVDQIDGITRIIDYKTGKVEPRNVKVTDWEELVLNYDKSKAFQLLCYAFLYSKKHDANSLQAGIYSFKNLSQGFLPFYSDGINIDHDTLNTFETYLKRIILEICDSRIPFTEKKV
ncbi:PD-(D/E)XK nuclease family protein [Flagellimonas sp. CMM7]|uniref:PD-(D/E)XK nuclease family protein n=1 Tax=Flagellimonas sp. CMM7 TaxID=2654676 RepID=UPI0013D6F5FA|nr:PD-(D/E)XK nuclease family protein [Flagellimonas sp. CMM7]UII81743.1 PD-(D/E)XK nuclease family protein [Flagellimonas sp. CMM7]